MFATLSAENRVRDRLQSLGATANFLAALSGIPATRISLATRGIQELRSEHATLLLELTARLIDIADAFRPLPISLVNPTEVRALLDHMDANNLTPESIRQIVTAIFKQ